MTEFSIYESSLLQTSSFFYNTSYTWGGNPPLNTSIFASEWNYGSIDQGFTYDNFYVLVSEGCSNCVNTTKAVNFNMTYAGFDYNYGTLKNSTHSVQVQPLTGYMYQVNYNYDMWLNISVPENITNYYAFPFQDLSEMFEIPVPVFNMEVSMKAADGKFYANQKYVPDTFAAMKSGMIWLIAVGSLLIVISLAIFIIVKCRKRREENELHHRHRS